MELFDIIAGTLAADEEMSTPRVEKADTSGLTFKRDEDGVLWSYDADGQKVGRIFEHGDDNIDEIEEK